MKNWWCLENPETKQTGGNALKFYSVCARLDVRRVGFTKMVKTWQEPYGSEGCKNKMASIHKVEFDLMYGEGISWRWRFRFSSDCEFCGINQVHGYSYNGERLGQGRDQAKMYLKDHPEVTEEFSGKV